MHWIVENGGEGFDKDDDDDFSDRDKELQTIFTTLLTTHFITPESSGTSGSSTSQHLGVHDEKVMQEYVLTFPT